jgi:hypothetical protein
MPKYTALILAALLAALAVPAKAQLARTFVSASGSDANNCDRPTPCRTFQHAHDNTLAAGEITVLDPGGYGAVTIAKSISIINDGVGEAGVLVSGGGAGITINAAGADVSLRGLTIKGIGFGGGDGIVINDASFVAVENCAIRNLDGASKGNGILYRTTTSGTLAVSNTFVTDNLGEGISVIADGSATLNAAIDHVELHNNGGVLHQGLLVASISGTVNVVVSDTIVTGSGAAGVVASIVGVGAVANLMVVRSVVAHNATGLLAAGPGATLRVGQSTVTGNATGWAVQSSGTLQSYGNNRVDGNAGGEGAMPGVSPM